MISTLPQRNQLMGFKFLTRSFSASILRNYTFIQIFKEEIPLNLEHLFELLQRLIRNAFWQVNLNCNTWYSKSYLVIKPIYNFGKAANLRYNEMKDVIETRVMENKRRAKVLRFLLCEWIFISVNNAINSRDLLQIIKFSSYYEYAKCLLLLLM